MRIVITGASGNVGTALLRHLADSGHELVGVSRRRPPDEAPYAGVEWHEVDLGNSVHATLKLRQVMRGADAVVHLAWLIQPSRDREAMRRTNQDGTRAVALAAREAKVGHFVHLSSIGAYTPAQGQVVDESWSTEGVETSPYSVDKVACERLLDGFENDFVVTRMRPTLILQEAAASEISRYFLGPLVPVSLIRPGLLKIAPWPKELALQFVHADDVATALGTVLEARAGGAFNVAADPVIDRTTLRDAFGSVGPSVPPPVLRAFAAITWRLRIQPTDPGWVDLGVSLPLISCERLLDLGWSPKHSGVETLQNFVAALGRREGGASPVLHPRKLTS